jgi:hypothetical protein
MTIQKLDIREEYVHLMVGRSLGKIYSQETMTVNANTRELKNVVTLKAGGDDLPCSLPFGESNADFFIKSIKSDQCVRELFRIENTTLVGKPKRPETNIVLSDGID